jgi:hypothetical protein
MGDIYYFTARHKRRAIRSWMLGRFHAKPMRFGQGRGGLASVTAVQPLVWITKKDENDLRSRHNSASFVTPAHGGGRKFLSEVAAGGDRIGDCAPKMWDP